MPKKLLQKSASKKDIVILATYLTNGSMQATAKLCGCSRPKVTTVLAAATNEQIDEARLAANKAMEVRLAEIADKATSKLVQALDDKKNEISPFHLNIIGGTAVDKLLKIRGIEIKQGIAKNEINLSVGINLDGKSTDQLQAGLDRLLDIKSRVN